MGVSKLVRPTVEVAIVGIDGSGKSTLARHLQRACVQRGIESSLVDDWFNKDDGFFHLATIFTDSAKQTPEVLAALYAGALYHSRKSSDRIKSQLRIWDRYIYSTYARCLTRGAEPTLMTDIVKFFPAPDLTIFLKSSPSQCYERIIRQRNLGFWEAGLDRLFNPRTLRGYRKYRANELAPELVRAVFCETMREYNQHLEHIIDSERSIVVDDFDFTETDSLIQAVIETLDIWIHPGKTEV